MFISEFWMGVIATVVTEFVCALIYTFAHSYDDGTDSHPIIIDESNSEDIKELLEVLKKMEEKSNGKNNHN